MALIKNLNLIYGTEPFLVEEKREELFKALHTEGSPNFNAFSGKGTDWDEVIRLSQTLPFLEDRRVISLSDTGAFKGAAEESLKEAFSSIPETTYIIFSEASADRSNALYKLFKASGDIFQYDNADKKDYRTAEKIRSDVRDWARKRLKKEGFEIFQRELEALMETCGYDMSNLDTELEKLICYKLSQQSCRIERADIEAISSRTVSDRVFDMISAKLSGNVSKALRLCEEMLSIKIPPGRILYLLERQFNSIYIIKDMSSLGKSEAEILEACGISDWQLRKLRKDSSSIDRDKARMYLELSVDLESRIKLGDMPERTALEILLAY